MSALGQKQTLDCRPLMSAIHPKADINRGELDVRFVPLTSDLRLDAPQQSLLRYSMRPWRRRTRYSELDYGRC
jgi:hypothetical protein